MPKVLVGGHAQEIVHLTHETEMLRNQLIVQAEQLEQEKLDRRADVDRLRLQIQTLKDLLDQLQPGFVAKYDKLYAVERQKFDPEFEKSAS